jgi:hypothetical protein
MISKFTEIIKEIRRKTVKYHVSYNLLDTPKDGGESTLQNFTATSCKSLRQ